jgi:hypothetical protein
MASPQQNGRKVDFSKPRVANECMYIESLKLQAAIKYLPAHKSIGSGAKISPEFLCRKSLLAGLRLEHEIGCLRNKGRRPDTHTWPGRIATKQQTHLSPVSISTHLGGWPFTGALRRRHIYNI